MAETVTEVINETLKENLTGGAENATARPPATPEGIFVAYSSLVLMAVIPIFFGSFRSIHHQKQQKDSGETPDTMTKKDAAMFPFIASVALFGLYLFFQIFSKEYINMLLTSYFFFLGILALAHLICPLVRNVCPASVTNTPYRLLFNTTDAETRNIIDYSFDTHDIISVGLSSIVAVWYILKKHWIANNLLGLAFSFNGVELLTINNVITGCILLGGLFLYDIFWVFGTNVMVTVAKSFEAPIKIVFPQDILENGLFASNFAMLGLGDIVVPGIFIALLLRFDKSLERKSNVYFNVTMAAYFLGLVLTIVIMHIFKHPQPALLYLVPACICAPVLTGLIKGDIRALFQYEDHPELEEKPKQK